MASVAYDLQQPGTRISAMKAAEETACTEQGFMGDILGIRAPAQQPGREVESGVDVGSTSCSKRTRSTGSNSLTIHP